MAVAIVSEYRVSRAGGTAFIEAARRALARAADAGARAAIRRDLVAGEATDACSLCAWFATAEARADFLDAIADQLEAPLAPLVDTGTVSLVGRAFLDELPAREEAAPPPPVLTSLRFRVKPGREVEADQALLAGIELRRGLGIEAHLYATQHAGARQGLRYLEIHAASHRALVDDAARVVANRARLGGLGPIPQAIAAGAMSIVESALSTHTVL